MDYQSPPLRTHPTQPPNFSSTDHLNTHRYKAKRHMLCIYVEHYALVSPGADRKYGGQCPMS